MTSYQLKTRIHTVIFGTDTPAGQRFDIVLLYCIGFSVLAVMLDTVDALDSVVGVWFWRIEWFFTLLFSVEYLLRIYCSPQRMKYVFSFYGLIDLVSIVPTYLALFVAGANYLLIIRLLRVLRVFRVLKMVRYLREANVLMRSIWLSRRKVAVFFLCVLILTTVFGCLMFVIEGPENGFTSIPKSIYWAIVTVTTVGYGDITPHTVLGQFVAALAMLTGYSILAIPTGIITAELAVELQREKSRKHCNNCAKYGHEVDAEFCKWCGGTVSEEPLN